MAEQPTVITMISGQGSPETAPVTSEINPDVAVGFYNEFTSQVRNNILAGEEHAVDAVVLGLATQQNVALTGEPGGGKSTLRENIHRFVEDINPEDVAFVPGQPDLSPTKLIGGETRRITREGDTEVETVFTTPAIIKPESKIVYWEEANSLSPLAARAAIAVPENKRLETDAGIVPMENLVGNFFSFNPSDSKEATFKISNALASRLGIGAIMGSVDPKSRAALYDEVDALVQNPNASPDNITALMSVDRLKSLGKYLMATQIDADNYEYMKRLTLATADVLRDEFDVKESDRRFQRQISVNARGLGGLKNADHVVKPIDTQNAVRMVVAARLGALRGKDAAGVEEVVKTISQQA